MRQSTAHLHLSLVGLLLATLLAVTEVEGRRIPPWHLKIAQSQGPNTCAVEEVPGTNKKYWTECKYWMNREICGVKTVLRYECCEGYHQVEKRQSGCTGVKPMTNVLQTARDLGATLFVDYMREAGLDGRLQRPGEAITLFAPTNQAFEDMTPADQETLKVSLLDGESPLLLYHVVGGRKLHSRDFHGEQEVESLNNDHKLRINRYSNGMMTVNCAPIVRKDQQATNGIVHLIDQVLLPPASGGRATLPELLFTDGRFRELARTMLQSNYVNDLRRGGPYTLLAPTDEAFQNILPTELNRMTGDEEARLALMKNHIIPHTICIPAVIDTHKMKTLGGHKVELSCNRTGVYVDGARVSSEQLLAENGVINIISEVLIPDRARSVMELVDRRSEDLSTFSRYLRSSGVEKTLLEPNISVTVFAPSNSAFKLMSEAELTSLDEDAEKVRELMMHHVVQGKVKSESISDNQRVDTLDRQNFLRLKVYRKEMGVESAIIEEADIEGQNGVLHVIDTVLTPPQHSIMELLKSNGEFSMLADAIQQVREFEPHFLDSKPDTTFTVFAPTNKAFHELGDDNLHSLMRNKRRLKKMVQNHVVDNMFSAGSIHSKLLYDVQTEYQTVKVHKEKGSLMVNSAHVIKPDVLVKDGIVHCIDQVLVPEGRRKS